MKQRLLATVVIAVLWFLLDWLVHGVLLMAEYTATASLWRPMAEMKTMLMHGVTIATAFVFVLIFCQMIKDKSLKSGIKLGVLVGLLVAIGAGIGSYSYMPITCKIATFWFLAVLVKYIAAGATVGVLVTKEMRL